MAESKLDAALDLARKGFAIFPCVPNGKKPAIDNWQTVSTTDPIQIKTWWEEDSDRNIGLPTANFIVVDVDPKKDGGDTLAELMLLEDFPKTARVTTQSGGAHIYYALPTHTHVKNTVEKLGRGIDTRSWGGYVVAPGSTIDGRPYLWANERPVAAAPQWLIERCNAHKPRTDAAGKRLVEEDETAVAMARQWLTNHAPQAQEGNRDDTAFKVAARLYDFGVMKDTATALLAEWSEANASPPMDFSDIERVAESAGRNRDNAIGKLHPSASGFEPVEIEERAPITYAKIEQDKRGLYFISAEAAAARALTHNAEPLIEGIIDCGTMSVVYGESNSGKSFLEMDQDFSIARGAPWAGRPVKQGAVVFVAAEGGSGVYKRVAVQHERGGPAPFFLVPCPVNLLRSDADVRPLIELVRAVESACGQKVVKVTLDTLSRVIAGGDENSSVDMGRLVHHFDAIREATQSHLGVIHHTGKDKAKGARGHSLLRAATDTEIEVADRRMTVTKQRDLDGDVNLYFRLVPMRVGLDARGKEVTSCYVETFKSAAAAPAPLTPMERSVLNWVEQNVADQAYFEADYVRKNYRKNDPDENPDGTPTALLSLSTIKGHLSALTEKGWIEKPEQNQYRRGRRVSSGFEEN